MFSLSNSLKSLISKSKNVAFLDSSKFQRFISNTTKSQLSVEGLTGQQILENSLLNKGNSFTFEERRKYRLLGLLPPHFDSIEVQMERIGNSFNRYKDPLNKHIYLRQLQDRNEVLFYRFLVENVTETLPIVYTPTVGEGVQFFSHIYRRPRGLFIPYPLKDHIRSILRNRPNKEVDVIVVTDGGRTLGIGDQGVGAMAIPVGKLSLYTLLGGIRPDRTLPILLDVGTDNDTHLDDHLYLGWRHERIHGEEYHDFIEKFVQAVKEELPDTLLQWEDFNSTVARPILEKYRNQLLTFNDDIQGTASVALGAVLAALNVRGETLKQQEAIVFLGAGSAGIGVADYLKAALIRQGCTEEEARRKFYIVDKDGLLTESRKDLSPEQRVYCQPENIARIFTRTNGIITLNDVVDHVKCGILIGLSTVNGAFSEKIVKKIQGRVERPIIFPLSNPTSCSEADPHDLLRWTNGKALVASGSPFPSENRIVSQCNNVYIFPAMGLALKACRATRVTDNMMLAAAEALGELSPAKHNPNAPILPLLDDVRDSAREIALAVCLQAVKDGVAPVKSESELIESIRLSQWYPDYDLY